MKKPWYKYLSEIVIELFSMEVNSYCFRISFLCIKLPLLNLKKASNGTLKLRGIYLLNFAFGGSRIGYVKKIPYRFVGITIFGLSLFDYNTFYPEKFRLLPQFGNRISFTECIHKIYTQESD